MTSFNAQALERGVYAYDIWDKFYIEQGRRNEMLYNTFIKISGFKYDIVQNMKLYILLDPNE